MPEMPEWLEPFIELISGHIEPDDVPGVVRFGCAPEADPWEVLVFLAPTEMLAGEHAGRMVCPPFTADVEAIRKVFDRIDRVSWEASEAGPAEPYGSQLTFEGEYKGQTVAVHLLAEAPEGQEPGLRYNPEDDSIEEVA